MKTSALVKESLATLIGEVAQLGHVMSLEKSLTKVVSFLGSETLSLSGSLYLSDKEIAAIQVPAFHMTTLSNYFYRKIDSKSTFYTRSQMESFVESMPSVLTPPIGLEYFIPVPERSSVPNFMKIMRGVKEGGVKYIPVDFLGTWLLLAIDKRKNGTSKIVVAGVHAAAEECKKCLNALCMGAEIQTIFYPPRIPPLMSDLYCGFLIEQLGQGKLDFSSCGTSLPEFESRAIEPYVLRVCAPRQEERELGNPLIDQWLTGQIQKAICLRKQRSNSGISVLSEEELFQLSRAIKNMAKQAQFLTRIQDSRFYRSLIEGYQKALKYLESSIFIRFRLESEYNRAQDSVIYKLAEEEQKRIDQYVEFQKKQDASINMGENIQPKIPEGAGPTHEKSLLVNLP